MGKVNSKGTEPEIIFRQALRRAGIRSFKVCDRRLPGKPDVVFSDKQLAIFIDGDFWHGNQYRRRGFQSLNAQLFGVRNSEYWSFKISRNIIRDFKNTALLHNSGWRVLRFWESDIRANLDTCIAVAADATKPSETAAFSALSERTVTELFAGIGLVRLALQASGWRTVFANDNDPQKVQMYTDNFGGAGVDSRSIHCLSANDIPTSALITASFPCNDLSVAGARQGLNGKQSSTFWALVRLLSEMGNRRPPLVLLENVPGFLTSHDGKDFESAVLALNKLGYSCDAFVVDAAHFTPQSRARLFVIGKQGEGPRPDVPMDASELRPKALIDFITQTPHLTWSIRDLPALAKTKRRLESILEDLPEDDRRWWNVERAQYFMNQLSRRHFQTAQYMIAQPHFSYGTAFRRIRKGKSMAELRVDGIAGCLRTPRGGSGRQILFKAGKGQYWVRLLTARECARLQGVPDESYKINVRDNQALFGFGDAVCVPVVRWIAEHYLTPLASELMRGRVLFPLQRQNGSPTHND